MHTPTSNRPTHPATAAAAPGQVRIFVYDPDVDTSLYAPADPAYLYNGPGGRGNPDFFRADGLPGACAAGTAMTGFGAARAGGNAAQVPPDGR